jgi:hypothetical protein
MRYDFQLIQDFCRESGLRSSVVSNELLEIDLGEDAVLCFQNAASDEDCAFGFKGTPWHIHDDLMFADARGNFVEMNYLDVLSALKEGKVLVAERWQARRITDRWLVHCEYNDELKYMEQGEEIRIWRAPIGDGK